MRPSPEEIFHEARGLGTPEDRLRYLRDACGDDAGLRTRVEALLRADSEAGEFLCGGAPGAPVRTVLLPPSEHAGDLIGRYKLLHPIGEGGFGSVWMAEQQQPVVRRVALKIIKLGMDTRSVIARFEAERQALAIMDHPSIARVLDAGATDSGRPYFVMELVKGEPITQYCDRNSLSIPERLRLFVQVCQAVQHAHTKGIIHRDLKPSNILVSTQDGVPFAKVIDFGIAKATSARLTDLTLFTEHRQLIGTPAYMSPEQAEGSMDLDTRTDIYSLGVLLYELLTGMTPFDARELREAALAEIQRIIREREPFSPSVRLSKATDTLPGVAAHRHTEPKALRRLVRGELDWIVMKALDKNRSRRYLTAADMAADVSRHLAHDPVLAGPASRWYRLAKLVRRNRPVVAAGAAVFLALSLGLGAAGYGLVRARTESRQKGDALAAAERNRRQTDLIGGFMRDIMRSAAPDYAHGKSLTVRQFIDLVAGRAGEIHDPETLGALRHELGRLYGALNQWPQARSQLTQAVAIREKLPAREDLAASLLELGVLLRETEARGYGEPQLNAARAHMAALHGEGSPAVLEIDRERVRSLLKRGRTAEAMDLLAACLERLDRLPHAEQTAELGASLLDMRASQRWRAGDLAGADADYARAVSMMRAQFAEPSEPLASLLANRATVLCDLGRAGEARRLAAESLEIREAVLPEKHSGRAHSEFALGRVARGEGNRAEAVERFGRALEIYRAALVPNHDLVAMTLVTLAVALVERNGTGDLRRAADLVAEAVAIYESKPESDPFRLAEARSRQGEILARLGEHAEGERLLLLAYETLRQIPDATPETRRTIEALIALNREVAPEEAPEWEARLRELPSRPP